MIKVYDSMTEVIQGCPSIHSAKNLIGRLETEDKYIGLYQPKRYRIVIGGHAHVKKYNVSGDIES